MIAVKEYGRGLEKTMNLGAAWIIQPISEYVMIPLLKFLRMFIPNYGVVIIVFSLIIKLALHPLTRTSMRSMRKMQALNPLMTEIREKYKDDPQKMNAQVMNLYKEYGVNPASGCLPLLLQMPILFALVFGVPFFDRAAAGTLRCVDHRPVDPGCHGKAPLYDSVLRHH